MKFVSKRNSKKENDGENSSVPLELEPSEDVQVQSHVQITVPPTEELFLNTSTGESTELSGISQFPGRQEPQINTNELLQPNEDLDDTSDVALKEALNELLGGSPDIATKAPSRSVMKAPQMNPAETSLKTANKTEAVPNEDQAVTPPPVPELSAYPDVKMSDKQLEALQSVLGTPAGLDSEKLGGAKKSSRGSSKRGSSGRGSSRKKSSQVSVGELIEKEDKKSIAKTTTFIIFLIIILAAAAFGGWYYWWTEHATFEYTLQPIVILEGQSVTPDEFLDTGEEMAGVEAVFENPGFEPIVGLQFVPLTLTKGWRTVESAAALYVLTPVEYIEHELAEEGSIRPIETLQNPEVAARVPFEVGFTEVPQPLESYAVGDFPLHLALNDAPFVITLKVIDTTPPTATLVDQTIKVGDEIEPESFISEANDASPPVTFAFVEYPNVFAREEQTVQIAVTDAFDNTSIFTAELTILFNAIAPVIEGTPDMIEFEIGHPIDYLEGVTALDDFDRELEPQVDLHDVDEETEGTYTAIYYAEDLSGLRTSIEVTVHVISVSPDYVNERADEILSRILRDGMSQERKALEIHNWIRWTLSPGDDESDTESITAAAYRGISSRRGDSNVYAAVAELLLTRAGIPNMRIERSTDAEDAKEHFWMLINPDDKGWHHFDAFPTGVSGLNNRTSMFTDEQAKDFAERIESANGPKDYYSYDKDLYPAIVGSGNTDDDAEDEDGSEDEDDEEDDEDDDDEDD